MPTHSSVPAWKIAWKEDPGGLQPIESQRVGNAVLKTCSISPPEPMSAPNSVVLPPFEQVHEIWASRATKPLFKISDCCHIGYHPPYSKTPWTVRECCHGWETRCLVPVWVCSGCHGKIPWAEWPEQQKLIFSQFWRLEAPVQDAADSVPGQSSLPGLLINTINTCVLTWRREWELFGVFFSYKDTILFRLGPRHYDLI